MNTPNISGSSEGKMSNSAGAFVSRRTEVSATPDISGSSNREVGGTPSGSGSSKEVWSIHNVSASSRTGLYHTHNASRDRGTEVLERQCKDTDPRKMTAEGSRHTSDTSQQPSAYQDQASIMTEMEIIRDIDIKKMKEIFEMIKEMGIKEIKEMLEIIKEMDIKKIKEKIEMMEEVDNKMAFPRRATQIQDQEEEETEMLKKQNKKLKAKNQELLAKAMAVHQGSEDINDPFRLSAVLERYKMLQLREWEKVRSSLPHRWTYAEGSRVIKTLFDACEEDIQQRSDDILKVLDSSLWNDAVTEVMVQGIKKLFRELYHQNVMVYKKIIEKAAIHIGSESEEQFLVQCCQIYCLLLLQDPPVKAEWTMNRSYVEHVDKKDAVTWQRPSFLWPIMKRGEEIIVKGVVWDQWRMR